MMTFIISFRDPRTLKIQSSAAYAGRLWLIDMHEIKIPKFGKESAGAGGLGVFLGTCLHQVHFHRPETRSYLQQGKV
jgi:hypothetical protein